MGRNVLLQAFDVRFGSTFGDFFVGYTLEVVNDRLGSRLREEFTFLLAVDKLDRLGNGRRKVVHNLNEKYGEKKTTKYGVKNLSTAIH